MAFIRKRNGSKQLIETYREDGKVKQRILANLGRHDSVADAIAYWKRTLPLFKRKLAERRKHLAKAEKFVAERRKEPLHYERPPEHQGVDYGYLRSYDAKKLAEQVRATRDRRAQMWLKSGWKPEWTAKDEHEARTSNERLTHNQLVKKVASLTKFIAHTRRELKALKRAAQNKTAGARGLKA